MKIIHYLNGKFVTDDTLLISPRDLGFLRGYAVFDFFRTYNGHKPFMFDNHIERLFNSARSIGISMPWKKQEVKDIILETLKRNDKEREFAVRVIVSGGLSTSSTPTLIVIIDNILVFPKSMYENGIKVLTVDHKRYNPASKTIHYIEAIQHMGEMYADGSEEMLYVSDNSILEGAFSNFFCVVNNKLVTAAQGILPGITRQVVIEKLKPTVPIEVRDLKFHELDVASEAFISVSGKGIVPVVRVGDKVIGKGKVGPITKDLINQLTAFIMNDQW